MYTGSQTPPPESKLLAAFSFIFVVLWLLFCEFWVLWNWLASTIKPTPQQAKCNEWALNPLTLLSLLILVAALVAGALALRKYFQGVHYTDNAKGVGWAIVLFIFMSLMPTIARLTADFCANW